MTSPSPPTRPAAAGTTLSRRSTCSFHIVDDARFVRAIGNIGELVRPGGHLLLLGQLPPWPAIRGPTPGEPVPGADRRCPGRRRLRDGRPSPHVLPDEHADRLAVACAEAFVARGHRHLPSEPTRRCRPRCAAVPARAAAHRCRPRGSEHGARRLPAPLAPSRERSSTGPAMSVRCPPGASLRRKLRSELEYIRLVRPTAFVRATALDARDAATPPPRSADAAAPPGVRRER